MKVKMLKTDGWNPTSATSVVCQKGTTYDLPKHAAELLIGRKSAEAVTDRKIPADAGLTTEKE